ncbi:glycosyltransferase family 4 protein [Vibrio kanaloae]|uniref:Glycosyltransferase family 4 protein n=1 Tax=Vibrio kanaloae TaxID=170673 RepID=A0A4U1ZH29_9VIBR|nr:glycosyltransferase family 4 protein [Vibrio kanaloae]TKF25892.1 glycosyltransferase family 4 protein [Vibrio kanaloae]TKF34134.1 glycosyltransferase family 4 protein [Vibrio kanaloae]
MKHVIILSPAPIKGSGGLSRIFNYAQELVKAGYKCDVCVMGAISKTTADIKSFYDVDKVNVLSEINPNTEYDLAIATMWSTATQVRDMKAKAKGYLVQDFEACFNTLGDGYLMAEESYMYGLTPFVYGRWLSNKLAEEFGNEPYYADFGTDLNLFKQLKKNKQDSSKSVCFILQPEKPRRCHILGINALKIVKHFRPDILIKVVGSDSYKINDLDYDSLGILSSKELNEVYNDTTVGFCISSSNPSCNAFDMMAAGLPCVELYRENNLYDMPTEGVLLAHQSSLSMASAIIKIIDDEELRQKMSDFGINYMRQRDKDFEVGKFLEYVNDMTTGCHTGFSKHEKQYLNPPVIERSEVNGSVERMYASIWEKDSSRNIVNLIDSSHNKPSFIETKNSLIFRIKRKIRMLAVSYLS